MIKAPFNFVPLAEQVYIPNWGDQISQDVPFSDGLSGTLKIKISAQTPIFIRDGQALGENPEIIEFCHTADNHYYIPATSIKGALRNVMEILSFGKMTQVQNQSFGIRDLSQGTDGRFYRNKVKQANVKCGWLRLERGQYLLDDCGMPWRISPQRIDEHYHKNLNTFIRTEDNFRDDDNRTAKKKYEMFQGCNLKGTFASDSEFMDSNFNAAGRRIVTFNDNGKDGTIVFTGQPGARRRSSGKYFEFVFPDEIKNENIIVDPHTFKAFETIHQDSPDYAEFRKEELKRGKRIPVFFILNQDGTIDAIGLSYMFKYPAYNSIYNGIPINLLNRSSMDICECVFGQTQGVESLKGRVQFTTAFLQGQPSFHAALRMALSKPHPSFYPLYLGNGQSWNNEAIRIAGRKRYPVRNNIYNNEATDAMSRTIRPINQGAEFIGYIHFHNLRSIELGALLSSIDFCGHSDCSHSLGQGKPLGFGRVKLSIESAEVLDNRNTEYDIKQAVNAYKAEMQRQIPGWASSVQLRELFAMAKGIPSDREDDFVYMKMSTSRNENQFELAKGAYRRGEQLGNFSQILNRDIVRAELRQNVNENKKRIDLETALEIEYQKMLERQKEQEQKKAQQELARLQQLKDQEETTRRNEARAIAEEADNARANKQYAEAISLYQQAAGYGFDSYASMIEICQDEINKSITINESDIETYLSGVKIASVNAFANNLKKRHNANPIKETDIPAIVKKLNDAFITMPKNDKKKWLDRKGWKPIEAIIGTSLTDAIFTQLLQN